MHKIIHTIRTFLLALIVSLWIAAPLAPVAQATPLPIRQFAAGPSDASAVNAEDRTKNCNPSSHKVEDINADNCNIVKYIVIFTNILSGIAGIIIVIMITYGGIKYSMAGPNPQAVAEARKIIIKAITALLLYIFGFAIIQWLVPGGLF